MSNKPNLTLVSTVKDEEIYLKLRKEFKDDIINCVMMLQSALGKIGGEESKQCLVNATIDGITFFSSSFLLLTSEDELRLNGNNPDADDFSFVLTRRPSKNVD